MSSLVARLTPSTSNYTPTFTSNPVFTSTSSSLTNSPSSIHSGPLNPNSSSSSPLVRTGNDSKKKKKKQKNAGGIESITSFSKLKDERKEEEISSSSPTRLGSSEADGDSSTKASTPESISGIRGLLGNSIEGGKGAGSTSNFFNSDKPSISTLLADPIRFQSTKMNLGVTKYECINDPDKIQGGGKVGEKSKGSKGKERETRLNQEDENDEDEEMQDSGNATQSNGATPLKSTLASTSKLQKTPLPSSNQSPPNPSISSPSTPKQPAKAFFLHQLSMNFPSGSRRVGRGMNNSGNTCYLNSTLQALLHTPPLLHSLLTVKESELTNVYNMAKKDPRMHSGKFLAVSSLQSLARKGFGGNDGGGSYWPREISDNLKQFAKPLRKGRQEDSHEFLRFLLESMQQQCVGFFKINSNHPLVTTTLPFKIFGGRLRSRVHCLNCKANSDTFENFLDLSLDINGRISSLDDALRGFTRMDKLEGSEKYKCEKCKKRVNATKQFTIDALPPILTIHLKRFTLTGGKMNKLIDFKENLNLNDCLSVEKRKVEPIPKYRLYAVVHHLGSGPNSGHYVSTVKDGDGKWKEMDDSHVSSSASPAGAKSAYMLFYQRLAPSKLEELTSMNASTSQKNPFSSPALTSNNTSKSNSSPSHSNGNINKKRKLLEDDEDVGQSESRIQTSNSSQIRNHLPSGSNPISKIVNSKSPLEDYMSKDLNFGKIKQKSSIPAVNFYKSSQPSTDDLTSDVGESSFRQHREDDEDNSHQSLHSSTPNSGGLSKSQKRKAARNKKKSSAHKGGKGELVGVKSFSLGSSLKPGMDNLSGKGNRNFNGNGNENGKNGRNNFNHSQANKMKKRK